MERIIHARLYALAEHHNILDAEQDGFRMFRGTTQSLLRFTQNVLTGFDEKKATLATFIDMENAFDSVWRYGLLVKLHEKGVNGTLIGLQTSFKIAALHVSSRTNQVIHLRLTWACLKEVCYHLSCSIYS